MRLVTAFLLAIIVSFPAPSAAQSLSSHPINSANLLLRSADLFAKDAGATSSATFGSRMSQSRPHGRSKGWRTTLWSGLAIVGVGTALMIATRGDRRLTAGYVESASGNASCLKTVTSSNGSSVTSVVNCKYAEGQIHTPAFISGGLMVTGGTILAIVAWFHR
jgi:hypothetical protein